LLLGNSCKKGQDSSSGFDEKVPIKTTRLSEQTLKGKFYSRPSPVISLES